MLSIYKKIIDLLFYPCILILFLSLDLSDNPPGWIQQNIPFIGNRYITDIQFVDSLTGYAVTDQGPPPQVDTSLILKTTNGGTNWFISYRKAAAELSSLSVIDSNNIYTAGGTGRYLIIKSTDAGQNWIEYVFASAGFFHDIFFVNKDTGWAGNNVSGGMFRTTNGGLSFQQQSPWGVSNIHFINKDTGWFSSLEKLFKTTNAGINWNILYTFAPSIIDIFFVSNDTGWITGGGAGTGILKTTNAGVNWISQPNPGAGYSFEISYVRNNKLWIGSRFNKMLVTSDGGNLWGYQTTPSFQNNSVFFVDSLHGWGGNPLLIHTSNGGGPGTYVGINEQNINHPDKFILYQNYPNPFNPNTVIPYELRIRGFVTLKVYNVQGKELKTLVNQSQNGGEYKFKFEGNDLPSGIYFYTINITDDKKNYFTQTNKMILTK